MKDVGVPLEQRHMGVHTGPRVLGKWFRHERGVNTLGYRHLPDHDPESHDVVRHIQRIGVTQIDLMLAGAGLVVAEFHGNTHLFQHRDGVAPEIRAVSQGGVIEVATLIERHRGVEMAEHEELDLRVDVEGEAHVSCLLESSFQHVPRVRETRGAVGKLDIAQHAGGASLGVPPGQHLEGRGVGVDDHVRLVDPRKPLDGRAVEPDALRYGPLHLSRGDRHRFQRPQHIGEPEAHEPDISFLHRAQHELCLPVHGTSVPQSARIQQQALPRTLIRMVRTSAHNGVHG